MNTTNTRGSNYARAHKSIRWVRLPPEAGNDFDLGFCLPVFKYGISEYLISPQNAGVFNNQAMDAFFGKKTDLNHAGRKPESAETVTLGEKYKP